jgi:hypothetical protein
MKWINKVRARRHVRASSYRTALEDLPDGLETAWRRSAPQEYPGIRTDAFFFVRAAEGLLRFFDAVRRSERPCTLPSDAADAVWHAWLRHEPIGLERFCRKHFGRVIPHVERGGLAPDALANTLMTGRRLEGMAPLGPQLPRLFGLDARLRMPGGHGYWKRGDEIVYARLGKHGLCFGRARPHPELGIPALLAAGLVDADMVLAHMRLQQGAVGGSACGSFADGPLDFVFASDGGCTDSSGGSDGGADGGGGSSCGSSCGGGCGGGD